MDIFVQCVGLYGLVGLGAVIGYAHRRWADWGELALVFLLWPALVWDNYNGW